MLIYFAFSALDPQYTVSTILLISYINNGHKMMKVTVLELQALLMHQLQAPASTLATLKSNKHAMSS